VKVLDSATRFRILERDHFTCRYCGRRAPLVELEIDHVRPRARNGTDKDSNLVAACVDCNRAKRDKFVELPGEWDSLEGKFFHAIDAGQQGRIVGLAHGYLVVRYFDWLAGAEGWGTHIVSFDEVLRDDWRFYSTDDEMRDAFEYGGVKERIQAAAGI